MNVLSLDLGSRTGYCYNIGPQRYSGAITWATDKELRKMRTERMDRRGDIRVVRFFQWMKQLPQAFDTVILEDVRFHTSLAQSQLWSSYRTAVWLAYPFTNIETVDVGTLKKFATGSGAADKDTMFKHLRLKYLKLFNPIADDNEVDATWLWIWAKINLAKETV